MKFGIALFAALSLGLLGCNQEAEQSLQEALAKLDQKLVIDLDAATARANTPPVDELAAACYPALKRFVQEQVGTGSPTVGQIAGAFDAYEAARKLRLKIEGGVNAGPTLPNYLKLACAALVQDERQFILRLAAIAAGSSVGVPGVGNLVPR